MEKEELSKCSSSTNNSESSCVDYQEISSNFCENVPSADQKTEHRSTSKEDQVKLLEENKMKTSASQNFPEIAVTVDLQNESAFNEFLVELRTFFGREQCSNQAANSFNFLIQRVHAHVNCIKEKLEKDKEQISKLHCDLMQFSHESLVMLDKIKAIFDLAEIQKIEQESITAMKRVIENCQANLTSELGFYDDLEVSDSCDPNENTYSIAAAFRTQKREIKKLLDEKNKICSQTAAVEKEKNKLSPELMAPKRLKTGCESNIFADRSQEKARLIAIISPFLHVHRSDGQDVTSISCYLGTLGIKTTVDEIEDLLRSYPSIFKCLPDEGTSVEKKWTFCGFEL